MRIRKNGSQMWQ